MAIGVDLVFVALMASTLEGTEPLRRKLSSYVNPSIMGTISCSAALNAPGLLSWLSQQPSVL